MSRSWREQNPEKRRLQKKRERARKKLRDMGILPPPGTDMSEEEKKIDDQISNNDFSYVDSFRKNKRTSDTNKTKRKIVRKKVGGENNRPKNNLPPTREQNILWHQGRDSAEKLNKKFNIDPQDIIIPEKCPYTHIKLSSNFFSLDKDDYCVLDLKDRTKNYDKDNILVISKLASNIKDILPQEYIKTFASNSLKIHKKI